MIEEKNSGIDIDLGNKCSQIAFSWAKKSFINRAGKAGAICMSVDGAFSNLMDFNGIKIGISSDGIGTKVEVAERIGRYDTLGYDLMAMVADDLVSNGIVPVNISNILDVDFLDADIVDHLMRGLHDAAKLAGLTITGGEIAELGNRIGGHGERMHFNWCATAIGILPPERNIIDGSEIKSGDIVIALQSRGFRSNGFSLLRKILEEKFGKKWHTESYDDKKLWGEIILTPSLIYTPVIITLLEKKFDVHGLAHITGGGVIDNLSRILEKNRLGASLDNLFPPLPVMVRIQELGNVAEETAYRLWNMGNGMLIVVNANEVQSILKIISEKGYRAQVAGKITPEANMSIETKGCKPQKLVLP